MSPPAGRLPRALGAGRPWTAAGRRRARDRRLESLRRFAGAHGWEVLGLHQDLSRRYPVPPLLGARSAQAELALTGTWEQWPASVLSVLVRQTSGPPCDRVVQVTALDTGPAACEFTASWQPADPAVVLLGPDDPAVFARVTAGLRAAAGALRAGDHVAADDVELLHTRELTGRGHDVDPEGPLRALAAIARAVL